MYSTRTGREDADWRQATGPVSQTYFGSFSTCQLNRPLHVLYNNTLHYFTCHFNVFRLFRRPAFYIFYILYSFFWLHIAFAQNGNSPQNAISWKNIIYNSKYIFSILSNPISLSLGYKSMMLMMTMTYSSSQLTKLDVLYFSLFLSFSLKKFCFYTLLASHYCLSLSLSLSLKLMQRIIMCNLFWQCNITVLKHQPEKQQQEKEKRKKSKLEIDCILKRKKLFKIFCLFLTFPVTFPVPLFVSILFPFTGFAFPTHS